MGRQIRPGPELLSAYEDWILMEANKMTQTRMEVDELPITTIQHYIGFEVGKATKAKAEAKKEEAKAKLRNR